MTPSIGPAEIASRARAICASRKFRTGRSAGVAVATTTPLVEALKIGGAAVRTVRRFVLATGKRFVTARLVGIGVTGLVARFVGVMEFVFSQCKRFVARATSAKFVAGGLGGAAFSRFGDRRQSHQPTL